MGSPLSATAANVVMEEIEKKILMLNHLMSLYFITDM